MPLSAGLGFAALSALFNGTFPVFTKLRQTRKFSPLIVNYWIAEGVALSGLLLLAAPLPRVFTPWGLLSGALFLASAAHAVLAVSLIGLAVATSVWCGTAVVVSFAWGVLVVGDEVEHLGQAALALALILAGIAAVALASWLGGRPPEEGGEADGGEGGADSEASLVREESAALLHSFTFGRQEAAATWQQQLAPASRAALGGAAAVVAGAVGGLILAPMLAAPEHVRGLQFVPSMALGALVLAPTITAALTCLPGSSIGFVQATSARAAGPGMAAGVCWNLGNMACIRAVTDRHVGLAVALPIMQTGLFVAGAWGILLFREIAGARALLVYAAGGASLVAGAALLAAAKED